MVIEKVGFTSQIILVLAILNISFIDPSLNLILMALSITLSGFASATQDSIKDACRLELAPKYLQTAMSGFYIVGYRVGMVMSGAGSLLIVSKLVGVTINYNVKAWQNAYLITGFIQLTGILVCILSPEPKLKRFLTTKTDEKFKSLITFFFGILVFILIYNYFPIISSAN